MDLSVFPQAALAASAIPDWLSTLADLATTDQPGSVAPLILPGALEYAALITGSISGALSAADRNLDIVGATALAMVTGLGGGLMRDVILPTSNVYMLDHPLAIVLCLVIGMMAFFFRSIFTRMDTLVMWVDILSVALFAGAGAEKALDAGYASLPCVFLGVITSVGGGLMRDVFLREVPLIFRRGTYYAIAALAGASTYVLLCDLHIVKPLAMTACVAVTVTLRMLSVHYNLQSVTSVDLTPHVTRPLRQAWQSVQRTRADRARNSVNHRLVVDEQIVASSIASEPETLRAPADVRTPEPPAAPGRPNAEVISHAPGAALEAGETGGPAATDATAVQPAGAQTAATPVPGSQPLSTANTPGDAAASAAHTLDGAGFSSASTAEQASTQSEEPPTDVDAPAPGLRYVRKPGLPLRPISPDTKDRA